MHSPRREAIKHRETVWDPTAAGLGIPRVEIHRERLWDVWECVYVGITVRQLRDVSQLLGGFSHPQLSLREGGRTWESPGIFFQVSKPPAELYLTRNKPPGRNSRWFSSGSSLGIPCLSGVLVLLVEGLWDPTLGAPHIPRPFWGRGSAALISAVLWVSGMLRQGTEIWEAPKSLFFSPAVTSFSPAHSQEQPSSGSTGSTEGSAVAPLQEQLEKPQLH